MSWEPCDCPAAAIRRYVEDSPRSCALLVLGRFPVQQDGLPSLRVLHGIESCGFRHRYGPIESYFPRTLPLRDWQMARDAFTALQGRLAVPILAGDVTTGGTSRGNMNLGYDVYSNTYQCFVLLTPHHRLTIGTPVRAVWNPPR